jgi:membrane protein DedA with SNARE-associated domain
LILRFGKYFLIPPEKLERAEIWLTRYETSGVFFARLLPVIRHLISYPAGLVRMNFWKFSLATITGSALWCSVLAYLGAKAYQVQPDLISNVDGWVIFVKTRSHWVVIFAAVLAVLYLLVLHLTAKRVAKSAPAT